MTKHWARTLYVRWLSSGVRRNMVRSRHAMSRRLGRRPLVAHYFHRVDDPYSQLMVQVIPDLMDRFGLQVVPHVVERLPANMYPDPARYEALSVLDAFRLARLYGLGLPADAMVPDRLSVQMCARYLASISDQDSFFAEAEDIGSALWRGDVRTVQQRCSIAKMDDTPLRSGEALLTALGHYASGALYFEGEFYPGLDRLDHLERRLIDITGAAGALRYDLTRRWRERLSEGTSIAGKTLDVYVSVRSPYSYLAVDDILALRQLVDVDVRVHMVMPMMMRGMDIPRDKGRYIMTDMAREAGLKGLPFGSFAAIGEPVRRAMSFGMAIDDTDQQLRFFRSFMRSTWAEGRTGLETATLAKAMKEAGLSPGDIKRRDAEDWEAEAEGNLAAMMRAGSWGVPTYVAAGQTFWGQDRLWAAIAALQDGDAH